MTTMDHKVRHSQALASVVLPTMPPGTAHETAIVALFKAWRLYARAHQASYDHFVGDDVYLGEHWAAIGTALIGLLNGETGGRVDGGTLDGEIRRLMRENGIDPEGV